MPIPPRCASRLRWPLAAAVAWLVLTATAPAIRAESIDAVPNPRQRDGTWVTDVPGMLRPETVRQLNELIGQLERDTSAEIAVVVVRTLDGLTVEDFAEQLFRKWAIGKKGRDNGILFLWASEDRRLRIEVGYGLEESLPDGKAGAILDQYVLPRFRQQAWDDGVLGGVRAVARVVRSEPVPLAPQATESYEPAGNGGGWWAYLAGLVGLVPVAGGGLFGFRRWRRYHARKCPQCQAMMTRLKETEEDEYLDKPQLLEESIRSVDYDVWKCAGCAHRFVLRYPKWFSKFGKCPQCRNKTREVSQRTVRAATTSSSGLAHVTETCQFCTYRREYDRTIPQIRTASRSGGSGSSGSSSRSSSFGGGRSGGGGASRGY